jgi:glycosyltransferase involved in cell wall biosynthesis
MRAGRPVVVTSHGGAPEIVRYGRDGLVADPLDPDAFASALGRLLEDEPLRARLAAAGPVRAAEFDWGVIAGRYREIYRRASRRRVRRLFRPGGLGPRGRLSSPAETSTARRYAP